MSSASVFYRGLKPVRNRSYSTSQSVLSLTTPVSLDSENHTNQKPNIQFPLDSQKTLANQIHEGIAFGNSVQKIQDAYDKAEFTPFATDRRNNIGQDSPIIMSNRLQKKSVTEAVSQAPIAPPRIPQAPIAPLQIPPPLSSDGSPLSGSFINAPVPISIFDIQTNQVKDSGFGTSFGTSVVTTDTDVVVKQNNSSLNPIIHNERSKEEKIKRGREILRQGAEDAKQKRQEKRLVAANTRANLDRKDILRKLFVAGNTN